MERELRGGGGNRGIGAVCRALCVSLPSLWVSEIAAACLLKAWRFTTGGFGGFGGGGPRDLMEGSGFVLRSG